MSAAHRHIVFFLIAAAFLPLTEDATAQVVRREYAIKASVLAMLGKCVTWPPGGGPTRDKPLRIGVLGKDLFVENGVNQLHRIAQEAKLKGAPIVVEQFDSIEDYKDCDILFVSTEADGDDVGRTVDERLKAAEKLTAGKSVLIVGDFPGMAKQGAMANLVFDRMTNLIRLEINPDAAARAGLKFTPDLLRLKLVQIVRD